MPPPPSSTKTRNGLTPPGTQAAVIRAVAAEKHPKSALAPIASRFNMLYADLRVIIDKAGYPDVTRMRAAAARLEQEEHDGLAEPAAAPSEQQPRAATAAAGAARLVKVRLVDLHVDPNNPRDLPGVNDDDIVELADSMTEVGLLQPIVAREHTDDTGTRLLVVAGHRRLTAARRLQWTTVDTIVRAAMPSDDVIAAMLIENGQRKDLNPIEEARGLRYLKAQMGETASDHDVARRVGRNQVYVSGRLALLALSAEDQTAIRSGDLNLGDAIRRGRMNSGKVRPQHSTGSPHLGIDHDLAKLVKARCNRLGHKKRGRNSVGGVGCGECWESVIRSHERDHLHVINAQRGECVTCGQPVDRSTEATHG